MTRPRVSNPRDRQLKLNLTQSEFEQVSARARAAQLRLAEYGRAMLLRKDTSRVAAPVAQVDRLTFQALSRIGNNLNQMARLFHATRQAPPNQLDGLLRDLRAVLRRGTQA